jgi:Ca2+-binding RTX toxin-like protein
MGNMKRFAATAAVASLMLGAASTAHAAVLASGGGTVTYIAGQGESNDIRVSVDNLLGQPVLKFTDRDANPIAIGRGLCELVNGEGMCAAAGVGRILINARDRDDTIKIATGGAFGPVLTVNTLIGGRGVDVLMGGSGQDKLKGNNGRDSLRGRMGPDIYRGGRGSDTLQTLDGAADTSISCGPGARDLIRSDKSDPRPRNCELGKYAKRSKKK